MISRRRLRLFFAFLIVLSIVPTASGYLISTRTSTFDNYLTKNGISDYHRQIVPPRAGITVVATDSNAWHGDVNSGPRARAELVAFKPNGSVLYYSDTHDRYWDVDQVHGKPTTVEYVYADHLEQSQCPTHWNYKQYHVSKRVWTRYLRAQEPVCTRNGVERVNLETGTITPIWSQLTPGKEATRYHDVDRLDKSHLVVADIYLDRVFTVNTRTDQITWAWNASHHFSHATGGPYPKDWTHINDVEVLKGGRIMVSVRNQDQVVFLNRHHRVIDRWTLGSDNQWQTLYEQHNPDYIPGKDGGPAVVVADSENNRIVEYQRTANHWVRTWQWRDGRLLWPRDADRLPNGHTLITDSNGNRVLEVNKQGKVVWSVNIAFPYEAERLGTGNESANGPSAHAAELRTPPPTISDWPWITAKELVPGHYLNGFMYVVPTWLGIPEVGGLVGGVFVACIWACTELVW